MLSVDGAPPARPVNSRPTRSASGRYGRTLSEASDAATLTANKDVPYQVITSTIDAPVTVDFEGGYSEDDGALAENVSRLLELGVIGINFEDRVVKGAGLYAIDRQARRIAAIRAAAGKKSVDLFLNARTDLFLGQSGDPAQSIGEALDRANVYATAGASGFFIPGLQDDALIDRICKGVSLPVNVMVMDGVPSNERLSELGVARISYGPIPYIRAMKALKEDAQRVHS